MEKREAVARAIWGALFPDVPWGTEHGTMIDMVFRGADAAIKAMQEPTDKFVILAHKPDFEGRLYAAMADALISAALKERPIC